MLVEKVQFEISRDAQVDHESLRVSHGSDLVRLGLIEEVHGIHLLSVLFFPDMHLLVIEANETFDIFIVENALHLASTLPVCFVLGNKVVPKFKSLRQLSYLSLVVISGFRFCS